MNDIFSVLTNLSAIIAVLILLFKAQAENKKLLAEGKKMLANGKNINANTDKSYIETYALLSEELKKAYILINELRLNQENIISHRHYEEYLIHCIKILTDKLLQVDNLVECIPLSFEDFIKGEKDVS